MLRPLHVMLCASTAALILGAAPIGAFVAPAQAQVAFSISAPIAPPLLPIYAQPPIPGPGYVWIPGYWAWDGQEYYWVPGYWAWPPSADLLWTPGYWAWDDGSYVFYAGYWGPTVGYYGDVDYGYGYSGAGYDGGYWRDNNFFYNRAVNNLAGAHIVHVYDRAVAAALSHASRVSYRGGPGGTVAKPTAAELAARIHRIPPTAAQLQHQRAASRVAALRYKVNHGRPPIAALQRAGEFQHAGAVKTAARAAPERPKIGAAASVAHARALGQRLAAHAHPEHAAAMRRNFVSHAPAMRAPAMHAMRPRFAYHPSAMHAPVVGRHFAYHAPAMHAPAMHAMRPRFAYHPPAMHAPVVGPHFAYHAPVMHAPAMHVMRPHFVYHAPAMHMGDMHMGVAHIGGAHIGGMRVGGGRTHLGGGGGRRLP